MQILVNTDNHIEGNERLEAYVQTVVGGALERFRNRITRVEVHLTDENSLTKSKGNDKRCVMEARPASLQPVSVTHLADTIDQAIDGAIDRLERTLKRTFDKLDDPKGRPEPKVKEEVEDLDDLI